MKLVYGVGINDIRSKSESYTEFYKKWCNMLYRAYNKKHKEHHPTYEECYVCDDWKYYSNFKAWMETQDWEGKELDKDLLIVDNKMYSPETCMFVDKHINLFIINPEQKRSNSLIGSFFDKKEGAYFTAVSNPFTKKQERYGPYSSEYAAHNAWKKRKSQLANMLADTQTDPRVINALRTRYTYEECELRETDYLLEEILRIIEAEETKEDILDYCFSEFPDIDDDPIRTFRTEYAFEGITQKGSRYKRWNAD